MLQAWEEEYLQELERLHSAAGALGRLAGATYYGMNLVRSGACAQCASAAQGGQLLGRPVATIHPSIHPSSSSQPVGTGQQAGCPPPHSRPPPAGPRSAGEYMMAENNPFLLDTDSFAKGKELFKKVGWAAASPFPSIPPFPFPPFPHLISAAFLLLLLVFAHTCIPARRARLSEVLWREQGGTARRPGRLPLPGLACCEHLCGSAPLLLQRQGLCPPPPLQGVLSEAVLALEAECQRNPGNAEAWRLLGTVQVRTEGLLYKGAYREGVYQSMQEGRRAEQHAPHSFAW